MTAVDLTDEEIRTRGLEALHRELGPAGLIRFLRQFELGRGDYSTDRHEWLQHQSLPDLIADLEKLRNLR